MSTPGQDPPVDSYDEHVPRNEGRDRQHDLQKSVSTHSLDDLFKHFVYIPPPCTML